MERFEALDIAAGEFARRLDAVTAAEWEQPSVCADWTVRDLVNHVVAGSKMSAAIALGASRDEAVALFHGDHLGDDPRAAFAAAAAEQSDALRTPGVLEATVHHPIGDVTGSQLLGFRIGDLTLHSWDLARTIGADETLDPELVEVVWTSLQPMAPFIGDIGVFGSGPSGDVGEDAPLQTRMLDLTGRRP